MKAKILSIIQATILISGLLLSISATASAAFNHNDIMDDVVFDNYTSMSAGQIDTFLNSFSSSCISTNHGFKAPEPIGYSPSVGFKYGGDVSAGTIIYDAATAYQVNPKAVLTTLQKEQSLVTGGSGCSTLRYVGAMGNDCPDGGKTYNYSGFELYSLSGSAVRSVSGTCVKFASSVGFARQVITATWKLKFFRVRAEGNVNWNVQLSNFPATGDTWDNSDDPPTCYNGYMTAGNRARSDSTNSLCSAVIHYGGQYTIDGSKVTMSNGTTAALYYYTPHFSGNSNFVTIFTGWFGSTTTACNSLSNVTGATSGRHIMAYQYNTRGGENLTFTQVNNTGSKCTEIHTWSGGYKSWAAHNATNMASVSPNSGEVIAANTVGDRRDELLYVKYNGSGSKTEVHTWAPDEHNWAGHASTILPSLNPTQGEIIAGDMNGDGHDELLFINYHGADNRVEVHTLDSTYHNWAGHALTNLSGFDPTHGEIITGNMDGRRGDELLYVKYNGYGGRVEVHTFGPGYHGWSGHSLTDLANFNPTYNEIITGDMNNDGKDELMLVKIKYGGPSGMVEIHTFGPLYHGWQYHATSNMPGYDPTT